MGIRATKIINMVLKKKKEINTSPAAALANKKLAIAAVTGGLGSPDWEIYMKQFVSNDDPDQLSRLLATDGTDTDQALIDCRAYLVSNGVCGEGTRQRFEENVRTIDKGMEADCEPRPEDL